MPTMAASTASSKFELFGGLWVSKPPTSNSAITNLSPICLCCRFVDSRTFASCSDDTTVALWDARNLSTKLRTLHGHSGWVKNIEYAKGAGVLLSSGLDGLVYAWELNNSTEQGCTYQRLLYMPGLMRCRLAPDESRLVLCTGTGYLMLVHDLDLASLAGDLVDFRVSVTKMLLKTNRPTTHPLISALFSPKFPSQTYND